MLDYLDQEVRQINTTIAITINYEKISQAGIINKINKWISASWLDICVTYSTDHISIKNPD